MKTLTFKIQDREFLIPAESLTESSFEVQSFLRPYKVTIQERIDAVLETLLKESRKTLLLIDKKVHAHYGHLFSAISPDDVLLAEATEEFKGVQGALQVLDFLVERELSKGDTLLVVGGGIIQDVGAFVGAVYKRGIDWVFFPTTLLAMADSCIGAKAGINYRGAKNQLALFSAPSQVFLYLPFLQTLRTEDIKSGLGEIAKLHIIGGREMFNAYTSAVGRNEVPTLSMLREFIGGSLAVKKVVIEADEFERNYRKGLNYGHTLGHAIEALSNYAISHGQAVVLGMLFVNELAQRRKVLGPDEHAELQKFLRGFIDEPLKEKVRALPVDDLGLILQKDKKAAGNQLTFIMPRSVGDMVFVPLRLDSALLQELRDIINHMVMWL